MTKEKIPDLPAELRRAAKISTSGYWAGVLLEAADEIEAARRSAAEPRAPQWLADARAAWNAGCRHSCSICAAFDLKLSNALKSEPFCEACEGFHEPGKYPGCPVNRGGE